MVLGWGINEEGWRKGPWTPEEDKLLIQYVGVHGEGRWSSVSRFAGLKRNAKSCRLRWVNYLRPDLKKGQITPHEENIILEQHAKWGNRWSTIARSLPGRTDNEIKNYWRTHFKKERVPSAYFKKTDMQPPRVHQYPQEEQQFLPQEDQFLKKMIMFLLNQGDSGVLLNQKEYEAIPEQQYLTSCLSHSNSSLPEMVNQSIVWGDLWNSNEAYSNMHVPEDAEFSPDIYCQENFTCSS